MENFFCKTKLCFGENALSYLEHYTQLKCFIVADPFLVESGMIEQITRHLKEFRIFHQVVPDPPLELVVEGIKELDNYQPEVLIAVGGGSAIDEAKAIMHFGHKITKGKKVFFIAIPTTSGTGSEVTSFAVITDKEKGIKYPLVDAQMRPDEAILDPVLVQSVPPAITADTGMDVLTHALEAYVSTKANAFTDALSEKATRLVFQYLEESYHNKDRGKARAYMHYASCLAGMAFDATSLGINHAIAHNIGGKFHLPHGRANAVLLPYVVEFNAEISDYAKKTVSPAAEKYAYLAEQLGMGGVNARTSVKNLINRIRKLQKQLSMPQNFRACGIKEDTYRSLEEDIITGAQGDACIETNPRKADRNDIHQILKKAW